MQARAPFHPTQTLGGWEQFEQRLGGALPALILFMAVYMPLLWLDTVLHEAQSVVVVMRPSAGLLLVAIWLARPARWLVFLVLHAVGALAVAALVGSLHSVRDGFTAVVPGALSAAVGAAACMLLLRGALTIQVALVPRAIVGAVAGALVGAGAACLLRRWGIPGAGESAVADLLSTWAGFGLGALAIGPPALTWAQTQHRIIPELRLRSRRDLLASIAWIVLLGLVGAAVLRKANSSLLLLPVVAGPALVFACFRLPPRWAVTVAALFILEFAALAVSREPPYTVADPYVRVSLQQLLIGIFATMPFLLSVGITQLRIAMSRLAQSENRYRSFVQLSHEAVWRMEVDPPMPVDLRAADQLQWLRRHASVVEHSQSYGRLRTEGMGGDSGRWWTGLPWGAEFEQRLVEAGHNDFNIQDMRFTVTQGGRTHTFLASVSAVVQAGRLHRLWGVARDVSELMELNSQLLREQERLRGYARQLVEAEEKARRATAVDLHDGIGQTLAGMLMIVEAARQQPLPVVHRLLDDLGLRLREIQELTRRMISDMSPPGLYDLGLAAALQWLAVNLNAETGLAVKLDCDFSENHLAVETRVLVFRLVRELLRNVVKHAGVTSAQVTVEETGGKLCVEVSDEGRGFQWPMEMFGERGGGFGLWSVADRIRDVGGSFEVQAASGRGSRFRMQLPLAASGTPGQASVAAS